MGLGWPPFLSICDFISIREFSIFGGWEFIVYKVDKFFKVTFAVVPSLGCDQSLFSREW